MTTVFFSRGKILYIEEGIQSVPKLIFYQYKYDFGYSKIVEYMNKGQFAFVSYQKSVPVSIELSPTYRTVINEKKILHAEINEKKGDKYLKTIVKIENLGNFNIDSALKLYNKKCEELILEKI